MPTLSGAVSRIFLFLKAVRYGRHEEILPEFLLTVKNLSFAPGGPGSTIVANRGRIAPRPWSCAPTPPRTGARLLAASRAVVARGWGGVVCWANARAAWRWVADLGGGRWPRYIA